MAEFASVLDDMYANTKITLDDVTPPVSSNPQVPKYALYVGLALVAILALIVLSRVKKESPVAGAAAAPVLEIPEILKEDPKYIVKDIKEVPTKREETVFRIVGTIPTSEDDDGDSEGKLSADKAEEAIQKYTNRT